MNPSTTTGSQVTTADTVSLAVIPNGMRFAGGVITSNVSLGTSTIAIGNAASPGKYKAAAVNTAVLPVLLEMIGQGVAEDAFDVPDITLAAETIMGMAQGRRSVLETALRAAETGDLEQATARLDTRMRSEGLLIDRLLGLPEGSVLLSNPEEYRLMLRAIAKA